MRRWRYYDHRGWGVAIVEDRAALSEWNKNAVASCQHIALAIGLLERELTLGHDVNLADPTHVHRHHRTSGESGMSDHREIYRASLRTLKPAGNDFVVTR